jgi:hypothetical protein
MLASSVGLALVSLVATAVGPRQELACQLAASADPALEDRWNFVDSAQFQVPAVERVHRGQLFTFYVFFEGYGTDADGEADLTYAVRITRPDGEVYHESDGLTGWRRTVAEPGIVLLAEDLVRCFFDPGDPLGTYTALVRATDGVTGASAESTTVVELGEYEEGAGFEDMEAVTGWIGTFAQAPELDRVAPALWTHCGAAGFRADAADQAADGFFLEILDTNPWLFPELFAGFAKRSRDEKHGVLWLLAHSTVEPEPFVQELGAQDRALWKEVSSEIRDPMREPLRERHDVNEVYGRYLASRRRVHLERLVLALHPDGGVLTDESMHSEEQGVDVPLARVISLVVGKLLGRLFPVDPIARGYAEALARDATLPEGVAARLDELLQ